jgi:two-component sensor histidine kinase
MNSTPGHDPIVEPKLDGKSQEVTLRALQQRIKQQEILAELGVKALQGASFNELLTETARLTAAGLDAEFCKVLEHIPSENRLLVRAGVGWGLGVIGIVSVGADIASPGGFALRTGKPVISNHLENEERFRTPELLQQHGIRRAMNVILQGDGKPFGVLEVDSRSENEFVEHDLAFLQGAANILGMAIERERQKRSLTAALNRHKVLLTEMNHRVKNSLTLVASMLMLQSGDAASRELTEHLEEASHRVTAIARAHDQLSYSANIESMDIGAYIKAISAALDASVGQTEVIADVQEGIEVDTSRAVAVALIVNELITNAAKYAYKGDAGGKIWITLARSDEKTFVIRVRDAGEGLPADFDLNKAKGFGMRIVSLLSRQLNATVTVVRQVRGSEFVISVPLTVS